MTYTAAMRAEADDGITALHRSAVWVIRAALACAGVHLTGGGVELREA